MATLEFKPVGEVTGINPSFVLRAFCVDREGGVTTLWAPDDSGYGPFTAHHWTASVSGTFLTDLPEVRFPRIAWDPAKGELVVVNSRCGTYDGVKDINAWAVNRDGAIARQGSVGDGVEDISVDVASRLFVSYFDEGVFGSDYWGSEVERSPSSHGLARFDNEFNCSWMLPFSDKYSVADCYAFTVVDEVVVLCPYVDFPMIRSDGESVEVWTGLGHASRALISAGSRVGLISTDYRRTLDGVVIDLESLNQEEMTVLVDGSSYDDLAAIRTHGHHAALMSDRTIYLASLLDIRELRDE